MTPVDDFLRLLGLSARRDATWRDETNRKKYRERERRKPREEGKEVERRGRPGSADKEGISRLSRCLPRNSGSGKGPRGSQLPEVAKARRCLPPRKLRQPDPKRTASTLQESTCPSRVRIPDFTLSPLLSFAPGIPEAHASDNVGIS